MFRNFLVRARIFFTSIILKSISALSLITVIDLPFHYNSLIFFSVDQQLPLRLSEDGVNLVEDVIVATLLNSVNIDHSSCIGSGLSLIISFYLVYKFNKRLRLIVLDVKVSFILLSSIQYIPLCNVICHYLLTSPSPCAIM